MHRVIGVAMQTGYLPSNFKYHDQGHFSYLDPDEVVLLCTGSQGEPRAALARIAEDQHPDIELGKGDLVIFSSRTIPGNKREVGRIQNRLVDLGCDIVTDGDALVHVTGHPRREEMKEMYGWVRPRIAIPMHGEARHLSEHAKLARGAGVGEVLNVRNGEIVRLAPGRQRHRQAPVGRLFRDGSRLVPSDDGPVRERRSLAFAGIVVVALVRRGAARSRQGKKSPSTGCRPRMPKGGRCATSCVTRWKAPSTTSRATGARTGSSCARPYGGRWSAAENAWGKRPIAKVLLIQAPR